MAWLEFNLSLEEELEVEKAVRQIRACDDIDELQRIAEQAYRAWVQQTDIVAQLIPQLADAEAHLAQLGVIDEPDEDYLEWARSLFPDSPD